MDFTAIGKWIESETGLDAATARRYAVLIGDTPRIDKEGFTLISDGDEIIDRVKLKWEI